ncbi:hypothetical protein B0T11DRAFT_109087 [Plectosphaerella cucumerina]|uniref:Ubiquitin-like-conjugating enzyme ATG10 n=1 Tax=Plectosphaerella cucumerina TaxID=40658 RepID=A0A8K0X1L2_9PEZI|nr:hypothetical protein B0T11DRAFT_109087 [Plectosphaerella cucumerina]
MARSSDFAHFPHLTKDEFAEVCHLFDRRYTQATLGPLRRRWQLRVVSALAMAFAFDGGPSTYVQIIRPLEADLDHGGLSLDLDKFSFRDEALEMNDQAMAEAEDADEAAIAKDPLSATDIGRVVYEIHLHPTYQMPCLWFTLQSLPASEPAFDIDTVFRRLVPDQFKDAMRGAGPIGGISGDHHPVTGLPSFFIHPCLLGDAMAGFDCSKDDYLMTWLGLVGGCVGLWVPKEMAMG